MPHIALTDLVNGATIPVNKPYRWTSFDVVNRIRYAVKKNLGIPRLRLGHAGTLDPLATGLLILCSGKHTKQIEKIQELEKEYTGVFRLGATTPSFDRETEIDQLFPFGHISLRTIEEVAAGFRGEIMQVPPVFSAIKVGGRRAFDFARKDMQPKLLPRPVYIHSFTIVSYDPPDVRFRIVCSKGTYIRSIARDLGNQLGSGAHLQALHRDRIGSYKSDEAYDLEDFIEIIAEGASKQPDS